MPTYQASPILRLSFAGDDSGDLLDLVSSVMGQRPMIPQAHGPANQFAFPTADPPRWLTRFVEGSAHKWLKRHKEYVGVVFSQFPSILYEGFPRPHGCILVFDCSNRRSFEALDEWLARIHHWGLPGVPAVLVAIARRDETSDVSFDEAKAFADENGMELVVHDGVDDRVGRGLLLRLLRAIRARRQFLCRQPKTRSWSRLHAFKSMYHLLSVVRVAWG
mmetsp:Transcript_31011/g.68111  ORF Transcript_31011/g.68111 Transcript_31011/m.68111 type:complete len:219 (-) Transcript_31011:531-1187(-)|eukprot:CAMPEP_0204417580 /NCGR_PEP_ID=MMETSP0470-20130426/27127_1 /ASSEMBLY_ACC=CAM_ASM_000385 /TAXON_ID=2969 /ORGANISM="Oxyrrhis marina" /LENGTH=218 /DNA_ID=CAMNT_0051414183 /DNA_START=25 /DNA_END=681 /DNA_ORIENTATION=+